MAGKSVTAAAGGGLKCRPKTSLLLVTCVLCACILLCAWAIARWLGGLKRCSGAYKVREIRNFLSKEECAAIIEAAKARGLQRSTVLNEKGVDDDTRTSRTTWLELGHPAVEKAFARAQRLIGLPPSHFEDLQIVHYKPNQFYTAHHDSCISCTKGKEDVLRVATLLIYLNDDYQGGHTIFKNAGADVKPETGKAVLFYNIDDKNEIIKESLHEAQTVYGGEKWACNLWARRGVWQKA